MSLTQRLKSSRHGKLLGKHVHTEELAITPGGILNGQVSRLWKNVKDEDINLESIIKG
jgi:hypothetical protein